MLFRPAKGHLLNVGKSKKKSKLMRTLGPPSLCVCCVQFSYVIKIMSLDNVLLMLRISILPNTVSTAEVGFQPEW